MPGNEGRGYILRRLIRRAVVQARRIGLPAVHPLSRMVVEQVGPWYPEVVEGADEIERVVRAEEERFRQTLDRGMREFEELAGADITAEDAFRLAATYGFPIELTVELAAERGHAVDVDGYRTEMQRHRDISRGSGEKGVGQRAADFAAAAGFASEFVGYAKTEVITQLGALEELGDGTFLAKLRESPFYPAGGGQVTDQGWIERDDDPAVRGPSWSTRTASRATRRSSSAATGSPRATACARSCRGASASRRWRTTPPPTSSRPRSARCSASTSPRRARPCGPTSCGSTSRTRASSSGDERERIERARQPRPCSRTRPCTRSRRPSTRPARSARWRSSARSTATSSASSR